MSFFNPFPQAYPVRTAVTATAPPQTPGPHHYANTRVLAPCTVSIPIAPVPLAAHSADVSNGGTPGASARWAAPYGERDLKAPPLTRTTQLRLGLVADRVFSFISAVALVNQRVRQRACRLIADRVLIEVELLRRRNLHRTSRSPHDASRMRMMSSERWRALAAGNRGDP
eukprot:scaffold8629_cov114-Isochrysis_galbana.AAC.8